MSRVILSDQAEADLDDIWFHIAQRNATAADHFIARIHHTCQELATSPRIADGIEVARALSGYRKLDSLFDSYRGGTGGGLGPAGTFGSDGQFSFD